MPSAISTRVTVSARWAESSRLSSKLGVAPRHRLVVSKAADHQNLVALAQVHAAAECTRLRSSCCPSGRSSAELTANSTLPLMPMRPLASVTRPDASGMASAFLQRHAAALFHAALGHLCVQAGHQVHLHHQHADQHQHKGAQQPDIRSPNTVHTGAVLSPMPSSTTSFQHGSSDGLISRLGALHRGACAASRSRLAAR
jgi:hypothetical protein